MKISLYIFIFVIQASLCFGAEKQQSSSETIRQSLYKSAKTNDKKTFDVAVHQIDNITDPLAKISILIQIINFLNYQFLEITELQGEISMNIAYNGKDGKLYPSGIVPESIQDPDDRKGYLAEIADNESKLNRLLYLTSITQSKDTLRNKLDAEVGKLGNSVAPETKKIIQHLLD